MTDGTGARLKEPRETRSTRDTGKLLFRGLLVLALVLQGYLSQVHSHAGVPAALLTAIEDGNTTGSPIQQPIDSDGRDHRCFICHLAGYGSISVLPQAIVLATVPMGLVVYRIAHDSGDFLDAPLAYASRAPPSLFVQA